MTKEEEHALFRYLEGVPPLYRFRAGRFEEIGHRESVALLQGAVDAVDSVRDGRYAQELERLRRLG